jgi:hypothetical protein
MGIPGCGWNRPYLVPAKASRMSWSAFVHPVFSRPGEPVTPALFLGSHALTEMTSHFGTAAMGCGN